MNVVDTVLNTTTNLTANLTSTTCSNGSLAETVLSNLSSSECGASDVILNKSSSMMAAATAAASSSSSIPQMISSSEDAVDAVLEAAAAAGGEDGTGYWTMLILAAGMYPIVRFLLFEYKLALQKAKDKRVKFNWSEQSQYRLDTYLSSSQWAKPNLLLSVTFLLIIVGAAMLTVVTGDSLSTATWVSWTYVADPGTHADAEGGPTRFVAFVVSIGGMLIFALMIGIISDAIGEQVDALREGKARVIESDHTLILGWSDKSLAIIQQIALANESEGGGIIVVMAEKSKEEMENILQAAIDIREDPLSLMGTDVVFREGNPLMEHDLEKVSVRTARSIIALSPDNADPDESDSRMVRQVLSLKAFGENLQCHVVVELQDIDNKHLVELVASEFVEVIVAHDIIGRLMIQCAREPGLAYVLESLMGFDGDEVYIEEWPQLKGKTFYELTCRFDDAVPIGVKTANGEIRINPKNNYVLKEGDQIMVLSEDNDTYTVNDGTYEINNCGLLPKNLVLKQARERLLFCGWRRDMADMIMQLDEYVSRGSELWLFNMVPAKEREELLRDKGNKESVKTVNLSIMNAVGNQIVRRDLKKLVALDHDGNPTGDTITLDEFDSILILADDLAIENGADMQSTDSRSLASLLIIQDLQRQIIQEKKALINRPPKPMVQPILLPESSSHSKSSSKTKHSIFSKKSKEDKDMKRNSDHSERMARSDRANRERNSSDRERRSSNKIKAPCHPISEILDTRTRSLLRVANCKGYIMSNQIVSSAIAQVSEDRDMNAVLGELLSADGCESYIRDISYYIDTEKEKAVSFWDVALRARQRREVAVGYKPFDLTWIEANDRILNPPRKKELRQWHKGDVVIIFALE